MRLPHTLAISLCLHVAAIWLLSAGSIYRDKEAHHAQSKPSPLVLSFSLPAAIRAAATTVPQPPVPATLPIAEEYLASSEVEQRARAVKIEPLVIPQRAYLDRKKGKLRLRAYIDEAGKVRQVDILLAEPPGIYEQAAIDALAGTVFLPARNEGRPVKTYKDIEIDIDPYESIGTP